VRWEPGCAQLMFLYSIDNDDFRAGAIRYNVPYDKPIFDPSKFMPPPCAIGWPPRLEEAMEAMSLARKIELTQSGSVLLSGEGRSVTVRPR